MPLTSPAAPRLAIHGNEWGLRELPQRPSTETWSLERCLEEVVKAGFDGFQGGNQDAGLIRSFGLRFSTSARINTPGEAGETIAKAADAGADALTVHLGWGMEDDAEMDALIISILQASERHRIPVYPETHRATIFQDIWRTCRAIERFPELRFNGDFSHYYCGQEMRYRGFPVSREYLEPILKRTHFLHGRISDGQCMQCNLADPVNLPHVENFTWLWREVFRHWIKSARPGDVFIFTPELGPPSSGYSLTRPDRNGERIELSDRWHDTLELKKLAGQAFEEAARSPA